MNHSDELYGRQWNEQMQHDASRYQNNLNSQWISCSPQDELIEEMIMYFKQLMDSK